MLAEFPRKRMVWVLRLMLNLSGEAVIHTKFSSEKRIGAKNKLSWKQGECEPAPKISSEKRRECDDADSLQ